MSGRVSDTVAIFCVGNYYLSDDGVGIHFFHLLKRMLLPDYVKAYEFGVIGFLQTDFILPYRKLIVVDALKGIGKPGEIFRFDLLKKPHVCCNSMISSHNFGIMELLDIVGRLKPENIPKEVILIGIEAERMDQYGTALSPTVEKSVLKVKDIIFEELKLLCE